ncbi:MAG: hypothetical protein ACSHWW_06245 [Nonlabens sp.]|uniref:hypothetical protein n=1 Tax=Nonlabens sp. TaxID=1888209 RepID=UPI003EF38C8B
MLRLLLILITLFSTISISAQPRKTIELDSNFSFQIRGDVEDLFEIEYEVKGLPATGYRYSSEAGVVVVVKVANRDLENAAQEDMCINNLFTLKSFYKGNFIGFKKSLDKDATITFKEISNQRDTWVADIEYDGIIEGLNSIGRCRFYFTPDYTYQVLVINLKESNFMDPMLSYDIFQFAHLNEKYQGKNQFMRCNGKDLNYDNVEQSPAFNSGYEIGRMIAPFLCMGFVILMIGGVVLIIINIQKRKRKKEQDEFDRYNN